MDRDQNPELKERRAHVRLPLEVSVHCHVIREGTPADILECRSLNISAGGIAVATPKPLPVNGTTILFFNLPATPPASSLALPMSQQPTLLAMPAAVKWSRERTGGAYAAGMQFLPDSKFAYGRLLNFIHDHSTGRPA